MAILRSQAIEFEVGYGTASRNDSDYFEYRIALRCQGLPLVNPILWVDHKRDSKRADAAWFYDWGTCPILRGVDKVLRTHEPVGSEPLEPQIFFAVYPPGFSDFPYAGEFELVWQHPDTAREDAQNAERLITEGPGPDDRYHVVLWISAWHLGGIFGDGDIGIRLTVKRKELESFRDALRAEWQRSQIGGPGKGC